MVCYFSHYFITLYNLSLQHFLMVMYNLKIGSHNIGGGASKLSHSDLISLISKFDIYCIQECWIDSSVQDISMPGYEVYRGLRKKGNKKKVFGGCLVFVKEELDNKHV